MPKEPVNPQRPQPAEQPNNTPVEDTQPSNHPVDAPPGDPQEDRPQEDRPMHDPIPPDGDRPRS